MRCRSLFTAVGCAGSDDGVGVVVVARRRRRPRCRTSSSACGSTCDRCRPRARRARCCRLLRLAAAAGCSRARTSTTQRSLASLNVDAVGEQLVGGGGRGAAAADRAPRPAAARAAPASASPRRGRTRADRAARSARRRQNETARSIDVDQLAHVARPRYACSAVHRVARRRRVTLLRAVGLRLYGAVVEEVLDEQRDVVGALAQRRQVQRARRSSR